MMSSVKSKSGQNLLIEPLGIETKYLVFMLWVSQLLIEPLGIETINILNCVVREVAFN